MKIEVRLSGEGLGAWIPEPWGDPKVGRTLEAGGLDFGGLEPGFRSRGGIQKRTLAAGGLDFGCLGPDSGAVGDPRVGRSLGAGGLDCRGLEPGFRSRCQAQGWGGAWIPELGGLDRIKNHHFWKHPYRKVDCKSHLRTLKRAGFIDSGASNAGWLRF